MSQPLDNLANFDALLDACGTTSDAAERTVFLRGALKSLEDALLDTARRVHRLRTEVRRGDERGSR